MKTSSNVIPKTQAYALIGGVVLLILCVCTLLAGWRLGLLTTADGGPQTAGTTSGPIVAGEPGSTQVDSPGVIPGLQDTALSKLLNSHHHPSL